MRTWRPWTASALAAALLVSGCGGDDDKPDRNRTTTTGVPEQVTQSMSTTQVLGVDGQFATFIELAEVAGLEKTLDDTEDLTVLAPHTDAFEELGADALEALRNDPEQAAQLLRRHLVGRRLTYQDLVNMHGQEIETLAGDTLVVSSVNGEIRIGGAKLTKSDILTENAVIHVMGALVDPDAVVDEQPVPDPGDTVENTETTAGDGQGDDERARDARREGDGGAEGEGWLLAAVWRARENRSDLAVFNSLDVESGPVALVKLGHRVPDGFHGNWVND